jgi:hypothetical protein
MGSFDQNSSYIPPFFAVFAQTLGQFPQNVGFCPDFLYIAHLGIPEIWAIARKDEFAQKSIFRWSFADQDLDLQMTFREHQEERVGTSNSVPFTLVISVVWKLV